MTDDERPDGPQPSKELFAQEEPSAQGEGRSSGPGGRRTFLKRAGAGLLATALGSHWAARAWAAQADQIAAGRVTGGASAFRSHWPVGVQRHWVGPNYWTNPLQDWRISDGRLELIGSGPDRNVHLLTRDLADRKGRIHLRAEVGFPRPKAGRGQAGFEIGVQGPLAEYRNNAIHGEGLRAGLTSEGRLFIEGGQKHKLGALDSTDGTMLRLAAAPGADGTYTVALSACDVASGEELANIQRPSVPTGDLQGNVALFASYGTENQAKDNEPLVPRGEARVWFRDLQAGGSKLEAHGERAFGPILFAQHTLSRGVMKMTAQMPPLGADEVQTVQLQIRSGHAWETIAEEPIHKLARTATFRITGWDDTRDVPYRLAYRLRQQGGTHTHYYSGTIRHDPKDVDEMAMGILSCATDSGFPHGDVANGLRERDPDLLAFTGDQFYESTNGYGVQRQQDNVPLATLDYLRKWYLYGWAFGDLLRERPAICMPDDHDVFQGNLWGEGGKKADTWEEHNDGGYFMPAPWVNMVQRTQTSHLPDPYDPTPVKQGITVYYADMLYGRVSFALLEDRKWKDGPDGLIPPHPGRPDHITDPDYDVERLDVPGAKLLGERQLDFLDTWAADWRGADLKVVVSQTTFTQVPTHHGRNWKYLVADLDSNGWPQTPRDEALRRLRKGFAFHVGGDQHLGMILQYGLEDYGDAGYNFCMPAIAVGYPRAFWPKSRGSHPTPGPPPYTGQYLDGLGNKVTVHAVANPDKEYRRDGVVEQLKAKGSGYGLVHLDKAERTFTMKAWPRSTDPRGGSVEQYGGWPQTVHLEDQYGRDAEAYLPTLIVSGVADPMVQIIDETGGEVVYTLRIQGQQFRPKVFGEGRYTIRVGDDSTWRDRIEGVQPHMEGRHETLEVRL